MLLQMQKKQRSFVPRRVATKSGKSEKVKKKNKKVGKNVGFLKNIRKSWEI